MAITERYVSSLAGGGGDGSSGSPWTIDEAAANAVLGDRNNVKDDGKYDLAADLAPANSGSATGLVMWRGYSSVIGDGGRPTIDGGASYRVYTPSTYHLWESIDFTTSGSLGVFVVDASSSGGYQILRNCSIVMQGSGGAAVNADSGSVGYIILQNCYVEAGSQSQAFYSRIHAVALHCHLKRRAEGTIRYVVEFRDPGSVIGCIVDGGGAAEDGIAIEGAARVIGNAVYNVNRDGIVVSYAGHTVAGNIVYDVGRYGVNVTNYPATGILERNAMGALTSGRTNGLGDVPELDPIVLTANPFTDPANGDFSLNNAAGGGALCRGAGLVPAAAV